MKKFLPEISRNISQLRPLRRRPSEDRGPKSKFQPRLELTKNPNPYFCKTEINKKFALPLLLFSHRRIQLEQILNLRKIKNQQKENKK